MKKYFILGMWVLFLTGCGTQQESPPIEKIPEVSIKPMDIPLVKKDVEGFEVDAIREVQLLGDKDKEILVIFHDDSSTYFNVYDYSKKKKEWVKVYSDFGQFIPSENYHIALTYPPFPNVPNEHVLIARQSDAGGYLSYFVLGEIDNKIQILLDNDFSEEASPIYQGDYQFEDSYLTFYSDGSLYTTYFWIPDANEYGEK